MFVDIEGVVPEWYQERDGKITEAILARRIEPLERRGTLHNDDLRPGDIISADQ